MKKTLSIIHFTFFIIFTPIVLFFLGCTSSTGSATGSLTGTVHLENQEDHSGIIIGIYELAELDPDIVEANTKWPHIGVKINQHTEFDHRFGTLVKTGETDASGNFEITGIPTGVYNVVAIKDGFGFRYVYEISISEGSNSLSDLIKQSPLNDNFEETDTNFKMKNEQCIMQNESSSSKHYSLSIIHYPLDSKNDTSKAVLTLYPETIVSSDISSPTTFESYHHYIIEEDITIDDELTIEPGAVVCLDDGVTMTIYGNLSAVGQEDNFIWFTSNDSINSTSFSHSPSPASLFEYKRIELEGSLDKDISFCKFDHAGTGLYSRINGLDISYCIFRDSQCGFKAEDVDSCFCSNMLCTSIINSEEAAIYFINSFEGAIENSIICHSLNGIKTEYYVSNTFICRLNFISACSNGIIATFYSDLVIENCNIENCQMNFLIAARSEPYIHHNEINGNCNIYLYYEPGSNVYDACPTINNNNLYSSEYFYYICKWNRVDIFTNQNYYNIPQSDLDSRIFDKDDYAPEFQDLVGNVFVNPKTSLNFNCGIK